MSFSAKTIANAMIDAVRAELSGQWPAARELVTQELRKLAATVVYMKGLVDAGKINAAHARALTRMQENTAREVLRTIEGIGVLTSRRTIEAAMRAAGALIGFKTPRNEVHGPAARFKAGRDL